jgi:O-antigen ligase
MIFIVFYMKKFFSPIITTPLIFFLLPSYLLIFQITDAISFNFLEVLLTTALLNNFYLLYPHSSLKKFWSDSKKISLPLILIIVGFPLSYIYNQQLTDWQNWSDGLGKLLDLIILPIIFGYSVHLISKQDFLQNNSLNDKATPPLLKIFSLLPLGMTATISYFFSATLIALLGTFAILTSHLTFDNRLALFFQSPNQLAIFLSPALIIGISFLFSQFNQTLLHSLKRYWLLYFSLLLLSLDIFFTKSLGSWLSLTFIILLLSSYHTIITNKTFSFLLIFLQRHTFSIIFLLLLSNLIFIVNTDLFLTFQNYRPHIPPTSSDSRLTIYQVDQKMLSNYWLLGVGIDNFQRTYLRYQKYFPAYPQWAVPHAHNNLIHFWLEGGLLSGLGLLFIYLQIINPRLPQKTLPLQTTPKQKNSSPPSLPQLSIPQLTLLYFIVHGLIDTTIWTPATATFFWFTVIYYLNAD